MGESNCVSHSSCPRCQSIDNLAVYDDGHSWCFTPGCGYREGGEHDEDKIFEEKNSMEFIKGEIEPLKRRGLTKATVDKWSYQVGEFKGKKVQIANYKNLDVQNKIQENFQRFWNRELVHRLMVKEMIQPMLEFISKK